MMICALVFTVVAFANAQQPGGGRLGGGRMLGNPTERVKQLDEKVKLSDEQKTKAQVVYNEAVEAQKKMREEMMAGGVDRQEMMGKMQKLNADVDAKINAFLSEEQKKAYKAWQDQLRAERQKMMRERMGGNQ